jgi:ATPase subunit of ABC transporter with duplicated ATPase domains
MTEAIRRALPAPEREALAWKIGLVLDMLETPEDMRDRTLSALSGGWQRLALIARVWVTDPDVLLLDEPTNHLDLQRLAVLENWVNHATDGVAMVIASHDRQFLDSCTNRTLFLRPDEQRVYAHPFSRARDLLAEDDAAREVKLARDAKEADRLRRNAGQLRNVGINSGSDLLLKKAKYLTNRAEAIEQSLRPLTKTRDGDIRLTNRGTHAKVLIAFDNVPIATPDGAGLFNTGVLKIFQRDRIVLTGANGVGKSVFVRWLRRAIEGEPVPGITVSPSVVVGYVDQLMSQLPPGDTLLGFITGRFRLGDQRSVSLLAGAGFDYDAQRRPIERLSPGQKARLGLLALRLTEPNFYLMDEPTNHVDIAGQERLETEILAHEATCVLVSHDRFFVRAIGTRFLRIEERRIVETESAGW